MRQRFLDLGVRLGRSLTRGGCRIQHDKWMKAGLFVVLLVVGCRPGPTAVKSPNENPAWSFTCGSEVDCFQQSRDVCPHGWDVFSSEVVGYEGEAVGNANYSHIGLTPVKRLVIVCHQCTSGACGAP